MNTYFEFPDKNIESLINDLVKRKYPDVNPGMQELLAARIGELCIGFLDKSTDSKLEDILQAFTDDTQQDLIQAGLDSISQISKE